MGGGFTCDGAKLSANEKKYHDFVLYYLKFFRREISEIDDYQ